jgi:hypothetical protein
MTKALVAVGLALLSVAGAPIRARAMTRSGAETLGPPMRGDAPTGSGSMTRHAAWGCEAPDPPRSRSPCAAGDRYAAQPPRGVRSSGPAPITAASSAFINA